MQDPNETAGAGIEGARSAADRVTRWSQKLLDLSLRNRLLNVRDTKQVLPLVCSDVAALEDRLAEDRMVSLDAIELLFEGKDDPDLEALRNGELTDDARELLDHELRKGRLWASLTPAETSRRLTAVYRQAKTDLEESGVNTLFLALGFVEWKVDEGDERSYLAPILLMPVRLQRKSLVEGIRLARLDEDTMINQTLLELLRSEFKLKIPDLDPLPEDDSGVDVARVFQIFRQELAQMKGWGVREEVRLGLFSFSKFTMWTDLTSRADSLKENALVRHLIDGGGSFDDEVEVFPPEEVARHLDLAKLYCPLNADSSQLTAVLYSEAGKNFVLHGPPGTGKSQTITNIIAHNLALGRRVLFVSEKKAALDVVHKRLSSIGLRPFCLELHSNKAVKAGVIAQFKEALEVTDTKAPAQWTRTVHELEAVRESLNAYVAALHHPYPNGRSAYDCFARLVTPHKGLGENLLEADFLTQSADVESEQERLVSELATALSAVDRKVREDLAFLHPIEWNPIVGRSLVEAAAKLNEALGALERTASAAAEIVGLPAPTRPRETPLLVAVMDALAVAEPLPESLVTESFTDDVAFLRKFLPLHAEDLTLREHLRAYVLERCADVMPEAIAQRIEAAKAEFFLIGFFKKRAIVKELSFLKKAGGTPLTLTELEAILPHVKRFNALEAELVRMRPRAARVLGPLWNDGLPEVDDVLARCDRACAVRAAMKAYLLAAKGDDVSLMACAGPVLAKGRDLLSGGERRNVVEAFRAALATSREARAAFGPYGADLAETEAFAACHATLSSVATHADELRLFLRYALTRKCAEEANLGKFAAALTAHPLDATAAVEAYRDAVCHQMLNQILAVSRELAMFVGADRNEKVRRFRQLDERYTRLARDMVFARIAAHLPEDRAEKNARRSELGILKRECEKKMRHKPVRQLLQEIPTLAPALKPCFLMSPLSVAQYLPADAEAFDLVVFDEASQIPVWDAIGVIARGKQLIVVGDPKQMPPTNFFQKGEKEDVEVEPDEVEDMESILDECLAAGVHSTHLNWHYRSRHESLISFSNHYYYDDRLYTFPASGGSGRLGVRFEFVDGGVYDRRSSRTNAVEARALVAYVFRELAASRDKPRSLGIVTFSMAQRELIENLLEEERRKHPEFEGSFGDQGEEPIFVKNLENVQGDERDVILFSVCYAPDKDGLFAMNFGPLNRQGGERRLNVAVTRAKEQIVVFSSVHGSQIDLNRTHATGAAHLKSFLDYAEKGLRIQNAERCEGAGEKGLSDTIAAFLTGKGYAVERQVGSSAYKIDLAVRDPDDSTRFLLGIECDGPAYAAQRTVRDRDSLRDSVLGALGWHIHRAWSVDWAFDRPRAEAALVALINRIRRSAHDQ